MEKLESENKLEGLKEFAKKEILRLGILTPEDPRYDQIVRLADILTIQNERNEYFRFVFKTVSHSPIYPTEFSKLRREDNPETKGSH